MQMIHNDSYPDDFFDYLYILLKAGNLYDLTNMPKLQKTLFQIYYAVTIFAVYVYLNPAELVKLPELYNDLDIFIEHLGMVIIRNVGFIKLVIGLWNSKKITKIIATLTDKEYRYEDHDDYKPGEDLIFNRKILNGQSLVFLVFGVLVVLLRTAGAIPELLIVGDLIETGNATCPLAFYSWIPFDPNTKLKCYLGVFGQSIGPLMAVFQIIGVDLTISGLCLYIRSSLKNVSGAFKTARGRCLARLNLPADYEILNDRHNPTLHREMNREVRRMSMHLQMLLNKIVDVEQIFNLVFLAQMFSTLFILVTCLYMLTEVQVGSPVFFAQVHYLVSMLIEFFPFCILGNEITIQAVEVCDGIYEMDWLSSTPEVKSTMLIHLTRLQKPIHLTVGKFAPLSLPLYVQVLRGSYSYFTVLSSMK